MLNKTIAFLRKYRGRIFYYSCVAAVLAVIAVGADGYRTRNEPITEARIAAHTEPADTPEPAAAPLCLRLPSDAEVIRSFSDTPVYNEALRQWETHEGTDIHFADGNAVSLCEASVALIEENAVVLWAEDCQIRYDNVVPKEDLYLGKRLRTGDPVARECPKPVMERWAGMHAHIELIVNGIYTDVGNYLSDIR